MMRRSQGSRMPLALGGNLIWSKLAPCLVGLENLRTESAYSEKLSALLAGVKLFVANYPFFAHSFLVNLLQRPWGPWGPWAVGMDLGARKCGDSLAEVVQSSWPGIDMKEAARSGWLKARLSEEPRSGAGRGGEVLLRDQWPHLPTRLRAH